MSLDWLLGPQLRAFAAAGYEVVGMSSVTPGADHVAALEASGIRHVALQHATRSFDLRRDVAALVELRHRFAQLRPTIVHTHNPKPGVYGRVAARGARVPVIVNTQHGLYALPEDSLARRSVVYGLERLAASCSDAELLQNVEDRDTLLGLGVPDAKLTVLGNGIDLARFHRPGDLDDRRAKVRAELGVRDDELVIGLVGRLVVEKGYREVFEAAAMLHEDRRPDRPALRFVVVGPTEPDKGDAISDAEIEAARAHGVQFLGLRTDVDELYLGMDCYVLASYREGFPRSAMEASACGLPVIATDIRGCRQVVADGVTGRLVPRRDPTALAAAIADLADNAGRRAAMARAAVDKARSEFDQERQIELTLATYDRLLTRRSRTRPEPV